MAKPAQTESKDWARKLIELYSEGYSDAEVAAEMKITIREYYKQIQENPVFAKLVEFGRTLSLAWWEGQARKNLNNKQFNTPLWVFNMKNKYGWADKTEVKSEVENTNINIDELRATLAKQTRDFINRHSPELSDAKKLLEEIPASIKAIGEEDVDQLG